MQQIPLNGRSFMQLVKLSPGINPYLGQNTVNGSPPSIRCRPESNSCYDECSSARSSLCRAVSLSDGNKPSEQRRDVKLQLAAGDVGAESVAWLSAKVYYTWSKSFDDSSSATTPQDSHNLRGDYGLSAFDVRNNFTGSARYVVPKFTDQPSASMRIGSPISLSAFTLTLRARGTIPTNPGRLKQPSKNVVSVGDKSSISGLIST